MNSAETAICGQHSGMHRSRASAEARELRKSGPSGSLMTARGRQISMSKATSENGKASPEEYSCRIHSEPLTAIQKSIRHSDSE